MADETQSVEQEDQEADATGGDDAQGKAEQREERDPPAGESDDDGESGDEDQSEESQKAQEKEEEREQAADKVKELEDDPPTNLEDWPDDAAKYETLGGPEGEHGYHEGPEEKLGPSSLRHHEDGRVTIAGEEVDDPDEYKSDPIPGGPTDPDASQDLTTQKIRERQGRDIESEKGDDEDSDDSDDSDESEASSEDDSEASGDSGSDDSDDSDDESKQEQEAEQSS